VNDEGVVARGAVGFDILEVAQQNEHGVREVDAAHRQPHLALGKSLRRRPTAEQHAEQRQHRDDPRVPRRPAHQRRLSGVYRAIPATASAAGSRAHGLSSAKSRAISSRARHFPDATRRGCRRYGTLVRGEINALAGLAVSFRCPAADRLLFALLNRGPAAGRACGGRDRSVHAAQAPLVGRAAVGTRGSSRCCALRVLLGGGRRRRLLPSARCGWRWAASTLVRRVRSAGLLQGFEAGRATGYDTSSSLRPHAGGLGQRRHAALALACSVALLRTDLKATPSAGALWRAVRSGWPPRWPRPGPRQIAGTSAIRRHTRRSCSPSSVSSPCHLGEATLLRPTFAVAALLIFPCRCWRWRSDRENPGVTSRRQPWLS